MPHTPGFPAIPGLYGISVTAELSGFTIATLRLYEQHGLITPARTRGGTRRYSARVALPSSHTSWEKYVEDYDRIRDTMSKAHDGFEDFNRRVRLPLGFRIRQPARELIFLTPSGRAEFSAAPLPDETTGPDTLILATIRSHDQWNTTIYSDNDRYRGIKNLRTLVFINPDDMHARQIRELDDVDILAKARDGSTRSLLRYKAIPYDIPPGCTAGYMPEMNVLCAIGDISTQSDQPIMKNLKVTVRRSQ